MAERPSRPPGVTQDAVRRRNLAALLGHVHAHGPTSRATLTAALGLNRSTIGALTADLVAAGLVRELVPGGVSSAGASSGRSGGRPSHVVVPADEHVVVVAVDLSVDSLTVALVGLGGRVLARRTRRHDRGGHAVRPVVEAVATLCEDLLTGAPACLGIGAAVPGVVRVEDGLVRFAPNLGWSDEPFSDLLAGRTGLSVRVGNDSDLGVLAEHLRGAAVGVADAIYLASGVGLGCGVVAGGVPLSGSGGYAGEAGHLPLVPGGRPCRCGSRGCWETEVGEDAVLVAAGRLPGGGPAGLAAVVADADAGDARAEQALAEAAYWTGRGLAALVNVLNPTVAVLGGVLEQVFIARRDAVLTAFRTAALDAPAAQVTFRSPALGGDSTLLGAAELAFAPLLDDPLAVVPAGRPGAWAASAT